MRARCARCARAQRAQGRGNAHSAHSGRGDTRGARGGALGRAHARLNFGALGGRRAPPAPPALNLRSGANERSGAKLATQRAILCTNQD